MISISETILSRLSESIAINMGLHFPKDRWRDLERGMDSVYKEFGFQSVEPCIEWMLSSSLTKKQIEILANHLTVGETYFFRDIKSYEVLENHILTELIHYRRGTDKRLRIWSAACCTGEEPYSIAILLSKMIPDVKDWNITILATDLNNNYLKKASEGVYTQWSFREAPSWIRESYFKKTKEDKYEILPHIKKMVSFSYLNLVEGTYPSLSNNTNAMDIIFCRNVLMYFLPEQAEQVIQKLCHSLLYGGWLILSPSETSFAQHSQFVTVNYPGVTLHRKERRGYRTIEDIIPKDTPFYWKQEEEAVPYTTHRERVNESEQKITLMKKPRDSILAEGDKQKTEEPEQNSYSKAMELYEQGRFAEAVEKLIDLYPENQKDTKLIVLLARAYANQGKLNDSLKWCNKAIVLEKMNPGLHYLRAIILNEQGLIEEAVLSLKRVLYLDHNFVLAHFILGNLSKQQGKIKEANKHFKNALSLLQRYAKEDILPESEGIAAGRLSEIIAAKTEELHE